MQPSELYYLISNTRRLVAKRTYGRYPVWKQVMDMFGCGSTRAREICLEARVDPDAYQITALVPEISA